MARTPAELASNRRVNARRLPVDLTVAGTLVTAIVLTGGRVAGVWVYLAMGLLVAAGGIASVIVTTRKLSGTRPEERGKRSDDKALAKAQRSWGCLPILFLVALVSAAFFRFVTGYWPAAPWILALGGVAGHLVGVSVIAWARRTHKIDTTPPKQYKIGS
jgi:hypothetical protein